MSALDQGIICYLDNKDDAGVGDSTVNVCGSSGS